MSQTQPFSTSSTKSKPLPHSGQQITPKKTPPLLEGAGNGKIVGRKEQRRKDWAIIRRLLVHIWPAGEWGVRGRVILGLILLLAGKVRLEFIGDYRCWSHSE